MPASSSQESSVQRAAEECCRGIRASIDMVFDQLQWLDEQRDRFSREFANRRGSDLHKPTAFVNYSRSICYLSHVYQSGPHGPLRIPLNLPSESLLSRLSGIAQFNQHHQAA